MGLDETHPSAGGAGRYRWKDTDLWKVKTIWEVLKDWKKTNKQTSSVTANFRKGKKGDPRILASITSIPRKMMEWILLKTSPKHIRSRRCLEVIITKWQSCLTNLIAPCNSVWLGRWGKSCSHRTVSCNIPTGKLMRCGLDKWTARWTENWLNCQSEGLEISTLWHNIAIITASKTADVCRGEVIIDGVNHYCYQDKR